MNWHALWGFTPPGGKEMDRGVGCWLSGLMIGTGAAIPFY